MRFSPHRAISLQPVPSLKASNMDAMRTKGYGPFFRRRLLVVAATALDDLPQGAGGHSQARGELFECHARIMPGEYPGDLSPRQCARPPIYRMPNCRTLGGWLDRKALHLVLGDTSAFPPARCTRQSHGSFSKFHG